MAESNRLSEVLCIYSLFADTTECKLAFLRNARDTQISYNAILDFVFNMFTEDDNHDAFEHACDDLIDYTCIIAVNYYDQLLACKFDCCGTYADFQSIENGPPSLQKAIRLAEIIQAVDHTAGKLNLEHLDLTIDFLNSVESEDAARMVSALRTARHIHNKIYQRIYKYYMQLRGSTFVGNPTHIVAEFMEFLSHVSTACCLIARASRQEKDKNTTGANEKKALAKQNFDSAVRHLNRVSLDMLKIANGVMLTNDCLTQSEILSILDLRHSYCSVKFGTKKLEHYQKLTEELMDRHCQL